MNGMPQANVPPIVPPPDVPTKPPLLIRSTLHLAWGLTAAISSNTQQSSFGSQIKDNMLSSLNLTNSQTLGATDQRYIYNLGTVIYSYLRRMGFEKDIYDNYLDIEQKRLQRKIEYWKSMGDMTNFSGDSTFVKIAGFFGIGAGAATIKDMLPQPSKDTVTSIVHNTTQSLHNATQSVHNVTMAASGVLSSESVYIILIFGTMGLFATIAFLKWFGNHSVNIAADVINKKQDAYWKQIMRPRYQKELEILYHDIVYLIKFYYPNYKEDPLITDDQYASDGDNKSLQKIIHEILPSAKNMFSRRPTLNNL